MQRQQILEMAREVGLVSIFGKYDDWIEAGPSGEELEAFAQLVAKAKAEELATELLKGPVNDTAASIAIWIRSQE
jgi:type IV pilus biogenesis protein CpaD/CtpE